MARIYRQHRSFLMLELLIALVLVGSFALPLARLPMMAVQEELRSAYSLQAQRLADLAFAEVKEKLHGQEIPWKEIAKSRNDKATVFSDETDVSFEAFGQRKFKRIGTIHSVGKKGQNSEEWRLVTVRITITPVQKGFKPFRRKKSFATSRVFTYQVVVNKTSTPSPFTSKDSG